MKVGQNLSAEDVRLIVGVEGDYHSIPEPEKTWQPVVDADGVLVGAFDEEVPAGLALLGLELPPGIVQVALLFVSRPYRRGGIAGVLMRELGFVARDRGAQALQVSTVSSKSAVGFYLSRGSRRIEPFPPPLERSRRTSHMLLQL